VFLHVLAVKIHSSFPHEDGQLAEYKSPGKHLFVLSHHPHYGAAEQISQLDNSRQT